MKGPIGIFDSGYGGLTVFEKIRKQFPFYDYVYLGDNARAPYGTRSFDVVYQFTRQAVQRLFAEGCPLVILACNTASAKALKTIQQIDLPIWNDPSLRVLGIIRPTAEVVGTITHSRHIGVLGTEGTISSHSYKIEIEKLFPDILVTEEACPMWAPLVENREHNSSGADFFIQKHIHSILKKDPHIDTLILGCTHYPLLMNKINQFLPSGVTLLSQGEYVAKSLVDYLERHPEMEKQLTQNGTCTFLTTESASKFSESASIFLKELIDVQQIAID